MKWREAVRAAMYPEPEDLALARLHQAYAELKRQGWAEAIYCPKDGRAFLAIEAGSSRPFRCVYRGQWPTGTWWEMETGDAYPAHPILWKPLPEGEK